MAKDQSLNKQIRSSIQKKIEYAEEEHRRELFRKRIELARKGLKEFELGHIKEAVTNFQLYIRILEQWKKVPEGGLSPSLFNVKEDSSEMLLISGVYWDLVKLFDRTKSKEKKAELNHYLNKFVMFSKGMHYEPLCAETLRKYISNEKAVHTDDFRRAYKQLKGKGCFIASALREECNDLTLYWLREFRGQVLERFLLGRVFIFLYYKISPMLADQLIKLPRPIKILCAKVLDRFALFSRWCFQLEKDETYNRYY